MFLPLGLDHMVVKRVPVVSATLAVLCGLGYLVRLLMGDAAHALGFVPGQGLLQVGWATSMFVHGGLLHLLGNMLFFYAAGPVIEDAWGRGRFLALFVLGDVVANCGMWLLDPGSLTPSIGASGAVAACVGALCVQYPARRVRMLVWILVPLGTFFLPVWLWGGLWFLRELLNLTLVGTGSGIAFGAHVAGFVFGLAMAVVIKSLQEAGATDSVVAVSASARGGWAPKRSPTPKRAPSTPVTPRPPRVVPVPNLSPATPPPRRTPERATSPASVGASPPPRAPTPRGKPRKLPPAPRLRAELAGEAS